MMYSSIIGVQLDQLVVVNPTELSNPMDGETKRVWLFLMTNLEMESNGTMNLATTEEFWLAKIYQFQTLTLFETKTQTSESHKSAMSKIYNQIGVK